MAAPVPVPAAVLAVLQAPVVVQAVRPRAALELPMRLAAAAVPVVLVAVELAVSVVPRAAVVVAAVRPAGHRAQARAGKSATPTRSPLRTTR
jgi:hypothetical protein